MTTIRHLRTLYFYDGPQVIEARDAIGGHYVGVLIEPDGAHDRFLVCGVDPDRLREFRIGHLDLLALLTEQDEARYFLATVTGALSEPLHLTAINHEADIQGYLPDEGFVLHDPPIEDLTLREAHDRNTLVLNIAVDPPEANSENRIRVSTLVGLLNNVQTLLRHAYGAALRDLPAAARRSIDRTDAHLMDVVVPAASGSFRIVLAASRASDLLGHNELARALERVDAMFDDIDQPEVVLERVRTHRGHFAGAFLRLLRFLVDHRSGMRYDWAQPGFSAPRSRSISQAQSLPIVELLSGVSNLGSESITLTGILEEADVTRRTWRMATDEGKVTGGVQESGPTLEGLRLGAAYEFSCIEEIEFFDGTGQEARKMILTEHRPR